MPIVSTGAIILQTLLDWLDFIIILTILYMIVQLFSGGKSTGFFKNLFSGGSGDGGDGGGDSWGRRKTRPEAPDTPDGGKGNGPEDLAKEYPAWADGFATVSVWVTDIDDNPISGAYVTIKHREIPGMEEKMNGYTGKNGTYGPKRVPAGPIMVKATHRGYLQYLITVSLGAGLAAMNPFIGGAAILGGLGLLRSNRYAMKDWYKLEKDTEQVFHIRLKRRKGQRDVAFEPKIVDVKLNESYGGTTVSRLIGKID